MKPRPVATVTVAVALLTAASIPALAQDASSSARTAPVSVVGCSISGAAPALLSEGGTLPGGAALLLIDFVNRADVDATSVRFRVRVGSAEQTIEDTGRFAAGTVIEHQLVPSFTTSAFGSATCDVTAVEFADGSSWAPEIGRYVPQPVTGGG